MQSDDTPTKAAPDLRRAFILPKESSTIKLRLREAATLEEATLLAYRYVMDNTDGITRIEFKYGTRGYIVVAKLKDDEVGEV
jgi:hypothetical protein